MFSCPLFDLLNSTGGIPLLLTEMFVHTGCNIPSRALRPLACATEIEEPMQPLTCNEGPTHGIGFSVVPPGKYTDAPELEYEVIHPFTSIAPTDTTPLQLDGKLSDACRLGSFPAAAYRVALCTFTARSTAVCRKEGHFPLPEKDMETTPAGEGLAYTPLISPPTAHTIASATSDAYPVLHLPSTRTFRIVELYAIPEKAANFLEASTDDT